MDRGETSSAQPEFRLTETRDGVEYAVTITEPVKFETSDKQEFELSPEELRKLNSQLINNVLLEGDEQVDEAIPLPNIDSATFATIQRLLNASDEESFLNSLSEPELENLIKAFDFLNANQLLEKTIKADIEKKDARNVWRYYDGTNLYNYRATLIGIVKKELFKKLIFKCWSSISHNNLIYPITLKGPNGTCSMAIAHDNSFMVISWLLQDIAQIQKLDDQYNTIGEPIMLQGHTPLITNIIIAHDNSFIVTGSLNHIVKIWKLDDQHSLIGQPIILYEHNNVIKSIAIANDNSFIVIGSNRTVIQKLDDQHNPAGQPTVLEEDAFLITCVAIANDNSFIVTGSDDSTIKIWKLDCQLNPVGKTIALENHTDETTAIAIANDNSFIVIGSNRIAKIWKLDRQLHYLGNPVILEGHPSAITSIAINNNSIVICSYDHTVKIWRSRLTECRDQLAIDHILLLLKPLTSKSKFDLAKNQILKEIYNSMLQIAKQQFDQWNNQKPEQQVSQKQGWPCAIL